MRDSSPEIIQAEKSITHTQGVNLHSPEQELGRIKSVYETRTFAMSTVVGWGTFLILSTGSIFGGRAIDNHIDTNQINNLADYQAEILPERHRILDESQQNMDKLRLSFGEACINRLDIITGSLSEYPDNQKASWLVDAPGQPCGSTEMDVLDKTIRYDKALKTFKEAQTKQHTSYDDKEKDLAKDANEKDNTFQIFIGVLGLFLSMNLGIFASKVVRDHREDLQKERVIKKYKKNQEKYHE